MTEAQEGVGCCIVAYEDDYATLISLLGTEREAKPKRNKTHKTRRLEGSAEGMARFPL